MRKKGSKKKKRMKEEEIEKGDCGPQMVRSCIRLTCLTLVCEVTRYRFVQVWQNLIKKKDFLSFPSFCRSPLFTISKDFIDQKRDEKDVQEVWSDISVYYTMNRADIRRSCGWYSVPTTTSPNICPVDGVVHRNNGSDFLYIFFVSLLVNKILWNVRMQVKNCRSFTQFCKIDHHCPILVAYLSTLCVCQNLAHLQAFAAPQKAWLAHWMICWYNCLFAHANCLTAKHNSVRRSFRSPDCFVLCDLQIFKSTAHVFIALSNLTNNFFFYFK